MRFRGKHVNRGDATRMKLAPKPTVSKSVKSEYSFFTLQPEQNVTGTFSLSRRKPMNF